MRIQIARRTTMTDKALPSDYSSRACARDPFLREYDSPLIQTHPSTLLMTTATPLFQQTHPSTLLTIAIAPKQTKAASQQTLQVSLC